MAGASAPPSSVDPAAKELVVAIVGEGPLASLTLSPLMSPIRTS